MITTTKIFGAIAILLLLFLVDTSSAQETLPPQAYPQGDIGDPENFLFEVNAYRLKYAKENNIPFMNKLTWNQSLAYDALVINLDSSKMLYGLRYAHIKDYRNVEENIEEGLMRFRISAPVYQGAYDQVKDSSADELELLIPLQSEIGCREREHSGKQLLCLLGPLRPPRTPAPLPPPNFDLDSVAASKFSGCFLVMTTIFVWFKWN
ncbi:hypothetical protein CAEBREN_25107 [Caenorhabditis brenneri]|uniref:Uncharacterized protein n=1 Tax=Caenorhabditis brenneri TaxID=135651 RepID=G0MDV7_CAEBE|nr:hypothetical protein CAEBREN_25107 [Caenorhabditis brenneri]